MVCINMYQKTLSYFWTEGNLDLISDGHLRKPGKQMFAGYPDFRKGVPYSSVNLVVLN